MLVATIGTLFNVPMIYSLLRHKAPVDYDKQIDDEYAGKVNPYGQPVES